MTRRAIEEAGLVAECMSDGRKLAVRDARPDAHGIRNRGGEALATLLRNDKLVMSLDLRESQISDNGIGHVCLAIRQTDQLEELFLSPVGHTGLEFVTGVVLRCTRLRSLVVDIHDVPTLHVGRQNLQAEHYDNSKFMGLKIDGEEEEEEQEEPADDEEEGEKESKESKLMRKFKAQDGEDSGEEDTVGPAGGTASQTFRELLGAFVRAVRKADNLLTLECCGKAVPADIRLDLERAVEEHRLKAAERRRKQEEEGARTALDVLQDQASELRAGVAKTDGIVDLSGGAVRLRPAEVAANDADAHELSSTRLGVRSFINRRLFAALGEALFECQRFKSKENAAVATPEGEMAFIAMCLRQHSAKAKEDAEKPRKGFGK